jgi:hypothetical protein
MMRNKLMALAAAMALSVMAVPSFAQVAVGAAGAGSLSSADSRSASGSTAASVNAGNAQSVIFTNPAQTEASIAYSGTQTLRNVPSVTGPNLTTSNDTCMGSTSGSINGPGFGVGLGTTWTDDNCVMLKNSRELWNMGMKAASMALMCTDVRTRGALEVTGFECPNYLSGAPKPAPKAASAGAPAANVAATNQPTDPYIRARLGLPPLTSAK